MLHGNVGGAAEHDNYAPCTVEELADLPFDYWALGHVHSHQVLRKHGPTIVYPGSPQGLSPRETGTHGCCLVTVQDDRSVDVERIATHSLRWEQLEVSIDDLAGEDDLLTAVTERLERELATGDSIVARVRVTGRGPLHGRLRSRTAHENLLAELRRDAGSEPFAWVDRLIVETRPALDLETAAERDDLPGDFLRLCREAGEGPLREELQELLEELFGHRAMRGVVPDLEHLLPDWLERAAWKGADLLLGEDGA
jgi:DNA repair exonuclease SbcCD nuclease subunit